MMGNDARFLPPPVLEDLTFEHPPTQFHHQWNWVLLLTRLTPSQPGDWAEPQTFFPKHLSFISSRRHFDVKAATIAGQQEEQQLCSPQASFDKVGPL